MEVQVFASFVVLLSCDLRLRRRVVPGASAVCYVLVSSLLLCSVLDVSGFLFGGRVLSGVAHCPLHVGFPSVGLCILLTCLLGEACG